MKHKVTVLILVGLVLTSLMIVTSVYAQSDSDGDGILDDYDDCPTLPGPRNNNGCPVAVPVPGDHTLILPAPGDSGGNESSNTGQPPSVTDGTVDVAPNIEPSFTPLTIPADVECSMTANHPDGVNIHQEFNMHSMVNDAAPPDHLLSLEGAFWVDGQVWYLVADPAGFVRGDVVITGGQCDDLPQFCVLTTPHVVDTSASDEQADAEPELRIVRDDNPLSPCSFEILPDDWEPLVELNLGQATEQPEWLPSCFAGLANDDIAIGVFVRVASFDGTENLKIYSDPSDENPTTVLNAEYYGWVIDGPVCHAGTIMWKVKISLSEGTGTTGWVAYNFVRPAPY